MIVTTITCGIKKASAIALCDDSKILLPQTNKSTTIVTEIHSHIQLLSVKYGTSTDKIGTIKRSYKKHND